MNIHLRYQQPKDAETFYTILNKPEVHQWLATQPPKNITEELAYLKRNPAKRRKNIEYNYSILADTKVVGAIGITITPRTTGVAEVGYFLDPAYWGRGIAGIALHHIELHAKKLKIHRIELLIMTDNHASIRVAEKAGYEREGTLKKRIQTNTLKDAHLYAKIL